MLGANLAVCSEYMHDRALEETVARASQSVVVYLENPTLYPLHRTDYSLDAGRWSKLPPEDIPAQSWAVWASESHGVLGDAAGWVKYRSHRTTSDFYILWVSQNNSLYVRGRNGYKSDATDYNLEGSRRNSRYTIERYLDWSGSYPEEDNAIVKYTISSSYLPSMFGDRDEALERRVARADKSVVVYLRNESPFMLKTVNLRRNLETGRSVQYPPFWLPPSRQAVWASESYESWDDNTLMGEGIFGEVAYRAVNTRTQIYLQWFYPRNSREPRYVAEINDVIDDSGQTEIVKYKMVELKREIGDHPWIIYSFQQAT